ncbi:MAG TPA: N-acetylmuramoyl-L-alanine amidase [Candidatus Elarobacter sp.]|jgi:N-acetylmuramoyl-L-alanine amidase|nr:N-acetylmuramoyl-L-alanine amidase [Candidatus Elarobacter sp.]
MNLSRVRAFSLLAVLAAVLTCAPAARAQERAPSFWFQGTRLIFDRAAPMQGDVAIATRDAGLRRFLDRLGASVAYQPGQRYIVITAQDRRTIVFTLGDPAYTVAGVRAQAPFAPFADGGDVVLPFYALARALYVEPVPDVYETVLQPRIGALDIRTDGPRTIVTVRGAMPLLTTTGAESPERVQLSFAGLGSSLAPSRRTPGTAVDGIDVTVGGSAKVPTTTITIAGARGVTHRAVASGSPDAYTVVFEPRDVAQQTPYAPPTPPPPGAPSAQYPQPGSLPQSMQSAPPLVVAGRATVTDLTLEQGAGDALAVRVALSGATSYEWHRLADNRWYVDFQNTTLSGPGRDEHPEFGAVSSVRIRQQGSTDTPTVRVAFTMTGEQRVDLTPSENGLLITVSTDPATDVARIGTGRTGGAPIAASAAPQEAIPSPAAAPWKYGPGTNPKLIVLDPGHGGGDTGTAHNGLVEKQLTLDIAQRVKALLVAQGWIVRMTREGDVDPVSQENIAKMRADGKPNADDRAYLQTRCDVANNAGARLFISIHINSAPVESARGTTVYWYKPQDAPFAQAIEKSIIPLAGTQDDGTRHENFYVVRHTSMPAVLIETAFVTNPGDVALLRQPSFLQNVAQGIANGVKAYAGAPSANALSSNAASNALSRQQ